MSISPVITSWRIFVILIHFWETPFSFACFIKWQTCLRKCGKSISFKIIAVVSFIFSIFNSSNSFFVISSPFSSFILFIYSISSFSITFSCLYIPVSRFSISFGFSTPFGIDILIYVEKKFFLIIYTSCDFEIAPAFSELHYCRFRGQNSKLSNALVLKVKPLKY